MWQSVRSTHALTIKYMRSSPYFSCLHFQVCCGAGATCIVIAVHGTTCPAPEFASIQNLKIEPKCCFELELSACGDLAHSLTQRWKQRLLAIVIVAVAKSRGRLRSATSPQTQRGLPAMLPASTSLPRKPPPNLQLLCDVLQEGLCINVQMSTLLKACTASCETGALIELSCASS
jgi:hypothetical protein